MNPIRGISLTAFAILSVLFAVTSMTLFPGAVFAQERVIGEFTLSQATHWGSGILPEGDYLYSVESNPSPAVIHVWKKGGGYSGLFVPQTYQRGNFQGYSGITLEHVGGAIYVASFHVGGLDAELNFSVPDAKMGSNPPGAARTAEINISGTHTQELFTIVNPNHEKMSAADAEKVYLKVCEVIEKEFNRATPIRPRLKLRLGAKDNLLHYPNREIQLKKWDEYRFAEAVVDIALHDLVSPEERLKLSKMAVNQAGATVSLCELKACMN